MGRSFSDPLLQPDGRVDHKLSNSTITIRHDGERLEHRIDIPGLQATYPVAYGIGAGKVGYSYLVAIGKYLFQSPVSFYQQTGKWDLTPGYETERRLDFTHQVTSGCLFCHTGTVRLVQGTDNQFENPPFTAISCSRCHGPVQAHLAHPTKGSIVNPAKLSPALRDAVCEQCHLEGEVRILNSGKSWWDFEPGHSLETVFVTYLKSGEPGKVRAVSQSEQLAQSRCARSSKGQLWCGTCHNPHVASADRPQQVREICLNCHQSLFTERKHKAQAECVSCHMPRMRPDDVAHASISDHRIPKAPGAITAPLSTGDTAVHAWREPLPGAQQRDLGLAYFEVASANQNPADLRQAYELLSHLSVKDARVLADLGSILLSQHFSEQAIRLFQQAAAAEPSNARYAYILGIAFERSGKISDATNELRRSIRLDPSQPDPYIALSDL